jgi:FG-GAP-like repeat
MGPRLALFALGLILASILTDATANAPLSATPAPGPLAQAGQPGSSLNKYSVWTSGHGYGSANQFLADVTGDGKADAVTTFPWTDGNWYVAAANAAGTGFDGYVLWATGHGIFSSNQFLEDVTGDGKADAVVTFSWSDGNWYVAEANASGTGFNDFTLWATGHGVGSTYQFLADVTGDGKADAVVVTWEGNWYIAVANTTGTGFNDYTLWATAFGSSFFYHNLFLGDVTGDGKADAAAFFGWPSWTWYVAEANSSGTGFNNDRRWATGLGEGSSAQILEDINLDSKADAVVVYSWPVTYWEVAEADSTGMVFNDPTVWVTGPDVSYGRYFAADVHGDGIPDPVAFDWPGRWYVSEVGSYGPGFGDYGLWANGHGLGSARQLLADVTGEGKADAVAFYPTTGDWQVAAANTAGTGFEQPTLWASGHGYGSDNQLLADVTGDGNADAVVFFWNTGDWYVAEANSSATGFNDYTLWTSGHGFGSTNQLLDDVTGDGKADAVVFFWESGNWYVAEANDPGAGFDEYKPGASGHGHGSYQQFLGDVTGDGKADAVVFFQFYGESYSSNWYVAAANASATGFDEYTLWTSYASTSFEINSELLADATGDGKADAVTFLMWAGAHWSVAKANAAGTAFNERTLWTWGHGFTSDNRLIADVTGDGRADAVAFFASDAGGSWYVAESHP